MQLFKWTLILVWSMLVFGCNHDTKPQATQEAVNVSKPLSPKVDFQQAARYNVQLGLSYLQKGSVARAKEKLNRAKKLAPELSEVHYAFGYFYEEISEMKQAEHEYVHAIHLHAGGPEYNNFGAFLCRQQRYKEAQDAFKKAILDPNYGETAVALENAGLCLVAQKKLEDAKKYFLKALQHDGRRATTLLELADIMIEKNDFVKANGYLSKYDSITNPTSRSVYLNIKVAEYFKDKNALNSNALLLQNKFTRSYENHLYQQEKQAKR